MPHSTAVRQTSFHKLRSITHAKMALAPDCRNVRANSFNVAPVVITSSIIRILRLLTSQSIRNASRIFCLRCAALSVLCGGAGCLNTPSCGKSGIL